MPAAHSGPHVWFPSRVAHRHATSDSIDDEIWSAPPGPTLTDAPVVAPNAKRAAIMATFITLSSFTDQGIRNVKDTTKRAEAVKELARKFGAELTSIYWTLGQYDVVAIINAPDDEAATAFGLAIGAAGNVRTETLRAFSKDDMDAILARLAA